LLDAVQDELVVVQDGKAALTDRAKGLVRLGMNAMIDEAKERVPKLKAAMPELGPGLGGAVGPVIGGLIKDFLPREAKPYAIQIGTVLGGYLEPFLNTFGSAVSSGASRPAGGGSGGGARSENPFLKDLQKTT